MSVRGQSKVEISFLLVNITLRLFLNSFIVIYGDLIEQFLLMVLHNFLPLLMIFPVLYGFIYLLIRRRFLIYLKCFSQWLRDSLISKLKFYEVITGLNSLV